MERRYDLSIFIFFLSIMVFLTPALGANSAAVISSLSGKVEVQRTGQGDRKAARLGDQLFEKDTLYTGKDAKASLLLTDGSIMALSADSKMIITQTAGEKSDGTIGRLSKDLMKGLSGFFARKKKRETRTIVAGIRKKADKDKGRVKVLYPRNSMISTASPSFRWKAEGGKEPFMISLTLKGMKGKLWSLQSGESEAPFPEGEQGLERGQTYFLRVESEKDSTLYDEVYFRVLDEKKAREVQDFEAGIKDLSKSDPEDTAPAFILAGFYKKQGLFHDALEIFARLEKSNPTEPFILEEKKEILAKLGLWEDWILADQKLNSIK